MKKRRKRKSSQPKPPSPYAGMSRSERAKAIGRLGGIARAKKLTKEQRSKISAKGGLVCWLRHGAEYYSSMTKARWAGLSDAERAAEEARLAALTKARIAKSKRRKAS